MFDDVWVLRVLEAMAQISFDDSPTTFVVIFHFANSEKNQPEGEPVISHDISVKSYLFIQWYHVIPLFLMLKFHVCWFHTACVARFLRKNLPKKLSSVDWWAVGATWDDENIGDFTEISPKFGKIREDPPIRWAFNVKAWLTCWLNQHGDKLWQDYGKWALLSGNFWVCQLENRH